MGQMLHGGATTTEAVRRAMQSSQENLRELAKRYGVNRKTVAKWKRRTSVSDLQTRPKEPRSTVLSAEDKENIVALRRHTLLPLDDCLYPAEATEAFCAGHNAAFAFFGGMPMSILYDNTVIARAKI